MLDPVFVTDAIERLPVRTPTLPPATHTNSYLVGGGTCVLIEPASPYEDEIDALAAWLRSVQRQGRKIAALIPTHHHVDHVGALAALAQQFGLPIWAHRETALRLEVDVTRFLADDEILELTDSASRPLSLRCIFTPGHAPGHLCFFEPKSRALLAGDMVASIGSILVDPRDGDMIAYLDSLEKMRSLAPSMLLPAHGEPIVDADAKLLAYRAHRLMREARIAGALGALGIADLGELVRLAYDDVPTAIWPLAQLSMHAHLIKLERDGRAVFDGARWKMVA